MRGPQLRPSARCCGQRRCWRQTPTSAPSHPGDTGEGLGILLWRGLPLPWQGPDCLECSLGLGGSPLSSGRGHLSSVPPALLTWAAELLLAVMPCLPLSLVARVPWGKFWAPPLSSCRSGAGW